MVLPSNRIKFGNLLALQGIGASKVLAQTKGAEL